MSGRSRVHVWSEHDVWLGRKIHRSCLVGVDFHLWSEQGSCLVGAGVAGDVWLEQDSCLVGARNALVMSGWSEKFTGHVWSESIFISGRSRVHVWSEQGSRAMSGWSRDHAWSEHDVWLEQGSCLVGARNALVMSGWSEKFTGHVWSESIFISGRSRVHVWSEQGSRAMSGWSRDHVWSEPGSSGGSKILTGDEGCAPASRSHFPCNRKRHKV